MWQPYKFANIISMNYAMTLLCHFIPMHSRILRIWSYANMKNQFKVESFFNWFHYPWSRMFSVWVVLIWLYMQTTMILWQACLGLYVKRPFNIIVGDGKKTCKGAPYFYLMSFLNLWFIFYSFNFCFEILLMVLVCCYVGQG
jgi:hypothetical protein